MARAKRWDLAAIAAVSVGVWGCPSDPRPREYADGSMDAGSHDHDAGLSVGSTLGDGDGAEQQPPTTGRAAVRAWLAAGAWRRWRCEATAHPGGGLSPHVLNRICTNDLLANAPAGAPWPVGAASVKVLYAPGAPGTVMGYALYVKVRAGGDGDNWFWYEAVRPEFTLDPPVPREADGTIAEGLGDRGAARAICVSCHSHSGANDSGLIGYGDFVFTRAPAP